MFFSDLTKQLEWCRSKCLELQQAYPEQIPEESLEEVLDEEKDERDPGVESESPQADDQK